MQNKVKIQPSCADAYPVDSLSVREAQQTIQQRLTPINDCERVAVRDGLGRVLAEDCLSKINVPGHTNSAMDGYAFIGDDLPKDGVREYKVIANAYAGQKITAVCNAGECVRIMTGAPMPTGTDTVVMQEQVEKLDADQIRIDTRHKLGQNVRQVGEDIAQGSCIFSKGRLLSSADIGVLASIGFAELAVVRRPRVAFFSTGDELRQLGEDLAEGEIYDSNRYTLHSMLKEMDVEVFDLGVVKDDPAALQDAFSRANQMADVLITSGGVSVGEADYTKSVLDNIGDMDFWSIAMKPGRPLTFGNLGRSWFFGLPGNPVAVMLTFMLFVRPALRYLNSDIWPTPLQIKAKALFDQKKKKGRLEILRGKMSYNDQGEITVDLSGKQGSGILTSMSRANCLVLLDENCDGVKQGDLITIEPFSTCL